MRTQNLVIGLNLLLGLKIYLYCGLWGSYYGWSYARRPNALLIPQTPPPFTSQSHSLFLLVWSLFFSPDFPTSSSPLIPLFMTLDKWRCYDYSPLLMRMGVQFHHLYVSVQVGKVVVALELIPTPKSLLGSDIP